MISRSLFWSTNGIKFEIIGPHSSIAAIETREIHDASLVIKAVLGDRKCLFAGDASDANLKYIADNTKKTIVMISCMQAIMEVLMAPIWILSKKCNAKYSVLSTKSGVHENVPHSTAIRRYKDNTKNEVYRTDQSGSLKWSF